MSARSTATEAGAAGVRRLAVDDGELAACVSCGLCLPHCPTWRVTGDEAASPRGRIAAMRAVHAGEAALDDVFAGVMDLCLQCRACETACPSAVPFGRLMEGARATLASETRYQPWWRRAAYAVLPRHRLLLRLSTAAALAQRAGLVPARPGLPVLPLSRPQLGPSLHSAPEAGSADAWLFLGCVMDAWLRPVHVAVQAVMEAAGGRVAHPGRGGDCCGALHAHAGLAEGSRACARRVMASMPGDGAIVVDSAGCGAALKDYGHLLGTPEAAAFSARVRDVHEWLAERLDRLPPASRPVPGRVALQDPCHLRHVQRAHHHVRTVLAPYVEELVELDDDGMCCGAGGAYSAVHPEMAAELRARKIDAIGRARASVVASANPGCALHLASGPLDVRHPVELVAQAIGLVEAPEGAGHGR
jgi:glycolate oxidase iron-sulfur subunit